MKSRAVFCALIASIISAAGLHAQTGDSTDITGLWKATKRGGPDERGPLIIQRVGTSYTADLVGFRVPVSVANDDVSFDLPDDKGKFRGKLRRDGTIFGIWYPHGWSTPVTLTPQGANRWSGTVAPYNDIMRFYLLVDRKPDGSLAALLANPEREAGAWMGVTRIVRTADKVELMGRRGNQQQDQVVAQGIVDNEQHVMTLYFPYRGGTYDFTRDTDSMSAFYPRSKNPGRYTYQKPPAFNDGWPTATPEEVGMDRAAVEKLVQQLIELRMDTVDAPQIHGLIIARKGKLVVEEYFHGEYRERLHDTRSASKSVSATIIGAAMQAGAPLSLSSRVYQVMNGGVFPAGLEPRKRAMTLEHLMTMSSGFFCDDSNDDAPGNEETMWNQYKEPNFYKYAMALPMALAPGEKSIYCSTNPNLALGMAGVAAKESPFYLFDRLVARPMKINYYAWPTDRVRQPYGGGGMKLSLRDFGKFGQLMLNGGTWEGRRILSREFVARASSSLMKIGRRQRDYGLLWWPEDYAYHGRKVHAFSALGAGGQLINVFPELDLVVASFGANYISNGDAYFPHEFTPKFILTAIRN